jgi:hypothetical protein
MIREGDRYSHRWDGPLILSCNETRQRFLVLLGLAFDAISGISHLLVGAMTFYTKPEKNTPSALPQPRNIYRFGQCFVSPKSEGLGSYRVPEVQEACDALGPDFGYLVYSGALT